MCSEAIVHGQPAGYTTASDDIAGSPTTPWRTERREEGRGKGKQRCEVEDGYRQATHPEYCMQHLQAQSQTFGGTSRGAEWLPESWVRCTHE